MPRILLPFSGICDNGFQVIVEFRRVLFAHLPRLIHNFVFHHNLILPPKSPAQPLSRRNLDLILLSIFKRQ